MSGPFEPSFVRGDSDLPDRSSPVLSWVAIDDAISMRVRMRDEEILEAGPPTTVGHNHLSRVPE
jgi:hypothetical protein